MSKQLVLVTGATGHIGFRTLVEVLRAGYRARITTRKIAQVEKVKAAKSILPYLKDLEYEEVADVTIEGAFDKAVKDVDFVLHLASPIPDLTGGKITDVKKQYLDPAREGTLNMLRSASKSKSIKRVVITSSVAVLAPKEGSTTVGPDDLAPVPDLNAIGDNPWAAYRASKILAYQAAREWMADHNPSWDLIDILPAYVQGRNELVTDWQDVGNGSNDVMIDVVTGKQDSTPRPSPLVLVDDVAKVEVAALNTAKGQNGDRYIAAYPHKVTWKDVLPVATKLFPEAFEEGILSTEGRQESVPVTYDSTTSTQTFGVHFAGLETMVQSLVGQYIELKKRA